MSFIPADVLQQVQQAQEGNAGGMQQGSETVQNMAVIQAKLSTLIGEWSLVVFILFSGRISFYASLFAAVVAQ
jgi:hypothetical protein